MRVYVDVQMPAWLPFEVMFVAPGISVHVRPPSHELCQLTKIGCVPCASALKVVAGWPAQTVMDWGSAFINKGPEIARDAVSERVEQPKLFVTTRRYTVPLRLWEVALIVSVFVWVPVIMVLPVPLPSTMSDHPLPGFDCH